MTKRYILPYFKDDKNVIACSSSNAYVPYMSVWLKSILQNANPNKNYDIVILETDISDFNKKEIIRMSNRENISIRFHNVSNFFDNLNLYIQYDYFAKQCYFRLAAGDIFNNYNKVLITDCDLIFNSDASELFDIDMKNQPLAACLEVLWSPENRIGKCQSGQNIENYVKNIIQTQDYYNTGVLLIDVPKFNQKTSFKKLIKIALENNFINQEQDVLNKVFSKNILSLNYSFNYEIFLHPFGGTHPSYEDYLQKIEHAKIYHYLTRIKVWFYPETPKGHIWWQYARQTPFYEEILQRLIDFRISQFKPQANMAEIQQLRKEFVQVHFPNINNRFATNEYNTKLLFVLEHYLRFRMKKSWYAFKKAFAFGKRYQKYNQKYQNVKRLLKDARKLKKSLYRL